MANKIPLAIADVELQLASAVSVGSTSFTLSSANDDDGNALPAGLYCFTIDGGTSQKEYLIGQLNGTAITSVKTVSRQGVETSGAARAHRVGATCVVTNFATLQRVADILRGQETLDGANPLIYDTAPTLSDGKELATVQYVLDLVNGGTVAFDAQTISGNAGEAVTAGQLVYFKTSDQEWYLTDADTAATVEGVQLGIALGTGSDGVAIAGGVQISGTYTTTGLTAGSLYYASNTAGAYATTAGTTSQIIGLALSTTKLLIIPRNPQTVTTLEKTFVSDLLSGNSSVQPQIVSFTASGTWTKDSGLKYVIVELIGAGGGGGYALNSDANEELAGPGGGAGGYSRKLILASALGATETVTVGAGGAGGTSVANGVTGGTTSFGSLLSGTGGVGATSSSQAEGGVGGTGSLGDINITGGRGGKSTQITEDNGRTNGVVGMGGSGVFGGEGAYGSGGRGGYDGNGANGTAGIVIVTEYYS
jgi:hypothetical protein